MVNHLVQLIEERILTVESRIRKSEAKVTNNVVKTRNRIPFDRVEDPIEILTKELEQFDVHKEIGILEQNRMKVISDNRRNFFHPVEKAINLTKDAIELTELDTKAAINTFIEVYELFPSWNKDLVFNAIKTIYELGDREEGIRYLVKFKRREHDYRSNRLKEFLKINVQETAGEIEGIKFEIIGEEIKFVTNKVNIEEERYIPIPYVVPVNLNIQDHGKIEELGDLTTREYEFLAEWITSDQYHQFEMRIPQSKMSEFMNSFIPTLQEMEISMEFLLDLEGFYLEDFMERMNMDIYDVATYGPDAEDIQRDYDERLISVGTVTVSLQQRESFIMEYALFVERYFLPQVNIIDYVEGNKQRLMDRIKAAHQATINESSLYFEVEFDREIRKEAKFYAQLCMLRDNFLQGKEDPYNHLSDNVSDFYYNCYLDLFDGKYEEFKIPVEVINEKEKFFKRVDKREHLIELIREKSVKAEVSKEWIDIEEKYFPNRTGIATRRTNIQHHFISIKELSDSDSIAVYIRMRRVMEILTEAHLVKLGYNNETRNVLADRLNLLRGELPRHIRQDMYDIKDTANGYAHKRLRNFKFSRKVTYTSEQMLEKFEKIMYYYITKVCI